MNKFSKLIDQTYNRLGIVKEEYNLTTGYDSKKLIDRIKQAIQSGANAVGNADVKSVLTGMFDLNNIESNTPLQKAIEKIESNPETPNLEPNELEALMSVVQDETTGETKSSTAPNQNPPQQQKPTQTPTTRQNSYNYNPNNQK
jgi:hypothetical protein